VSLPSLDLAAALRDLRAKGPLVHNLTNYVVMNTTANALLALGASPAMVHAREEVADFVRLSSAFVANLGTLEPAWIEAMELAAAAANDAGIPWVLDPVGAGATPLRNDAAARGLALQPAVLRCNASELLAVAGAAAQGKGVDAGDDSLAVRPVAEAVARQRGLVVAITGATDVVTDGATTVLIEGSHPLLTRVTGTGCTATALVGAFLGVRPPLEAAVAALAALAVVGEAAAADEPGPGTLQVRLLDGLHALTPAQLGAARVRVEAAA
jgi:hydroxyethylthiazole kinase